jgi:pimeloyl-ACP methyl ester carboxylesterase
MSMGGYVLFNLVERYRQRLSAACFLVTRATADDEDGKARRLRLAREVREMGPQAVADAFEAILFAPASLTERPKLVAEVFSWMTSTDSRGLAGGLLAMRERKDYTPLMGDFSVPALAIGALEDRTISPDQVRAIAAGIPGCSLCLIPEAGHMVNLEYPAAFTDCLLDFLRTLEL